ncbi:MAG: hypothetical protein R3E32_03400 [Chitinophagales bacterium]
MISIKNLVKTSSFVLVLTLLLSGSVFAKTPMGVTSHIRVVTEDNTQAIALYIPETDAPKVSIKIKNDANDVLFEKRAKVENGYARKLDLSGLKDGRYHLIITDEIKVVNQAFQIANGEVLMSKSDRFTFTRPIVQYNPARQLMQVVAFTDKDIEVNVFNANGENIIQEKGAQPSEVYNLSVLRKGDYTVEVLCEGERFFQTIQL